MTSKDLRDFAVKVALLRSELNRDASRKPRAEMRFWEVDSDFWVWPLTPVSEPWIIMANADPDPARMLFVHLCITSFKHLG